MGRAAVAKARKQSFDGVSPCASTEQQRPHHGLGVESHIDVVVIGSARPANSLSFRVGPRIRAHWHAEQEAAVRLSQAESQHGEARLQRVATAGLVGAGRGRDWGSSRLELKAKNGVGGEVSSQLDSPGRNAILNA